MGNKKRKKIYTVILLVLIGVIGFSAFKIGSIFYRYYLGNKAYKQIEELAGTKEIKEGPQKKNPLKVDFKALEEVNPDIRAWLYSKDTPINYPVVQGTDNSKYIGCMFNGEWNGSGTLFIDYRCENPFEDFNTIIYGHRMKDKSMFGSLSYYYDDAEYYNKHKTMKLVTPDAKYNLKIFAVEIIPANSELYNLKFNSDEEKAAYIEQVMLANRIDTDINIIPADKIVMLSTCTAELDDKRLVVFGKLRRIKEKE